MIRKLQCWTYSCTPVTNAEEVLGEVWVTLERVDGANVSREVGHNLFQGRLGFSVTGHDHPLLCSDHELSGLDKKRR